MEPGTLDFNFVCSLHRYLERPQVNAQFFGDNHGILDEIGTACQVFSGKYLKNFLFFLAIFNRSLYVDIHANFHEK